MEDNITIIPATEKHIQSVSAMTAHYFPYTGFTTSEMKRRLSTGKVVYLVALAEGRTAGFIDYEIKEEGKAQILGLAVLDEFRGKGIAAALVKAALGDLEGKGAGNVDLLVSESNETAKKLYGKFGFSLVGKLDRRIWHEEVLVMTKNLGGKRA